MSCFMSMLIGGDEILKRQFVTASEAMASSQTCLGKTLTIIDAAFTSATQAKAVKDLIRHAFYEMENKFINPEEGGLLPTVDGAKDGRWGAATLTFKPLQVIGKEGNVA